MSLIMQVLDSLKWSRSIGAKLLRVVPLYTVSVVILTLVAQLSQILTFLLPLKVIILLGSERIPRYFPPSWQSIDHQQLVIVLAVAAIGFYVLNIVCEKLIAIYAEKGGEDLLLRSRKITLFDNQAAITKGAYLRYVGALSGFIFAVLAFSLISFLYWELAALVLLFLMLVFFVCALLYRRSEWLELQLREKLSVTINTLSSVGFLLAFSFMVYDFLAGAALSVTVAVVCLLLIRQLMIRLSGCVTAIASLYSQRIKINALFFHGQQVIAKKSAFEDKKFWGLLDVGVRRRWLAEIIREFTGLEFTVIRCDWREVVLGNIIILEAQAESSDGELLGRFLVKLFHGSRQSLANHESSLLLETPPGAVPALPLVGISSVGKYCCHVFALPNERPISKEEFKYRRRDVVKRLLSYEPERSLVERYCRSKQLLWQRLDESIIDRLEQINSNSLYISHLVTLRSMFDSVIKKIQALPVYVINPDIKQETLINLVDAGPVVIHWGRWSMEPIGAGWPVKESELKSLASSVEKAALIRSSLATISLMDVRLAALMYSFENFYHRQHFIKALELLPKIILCVDGDYKMANLESI